MTKRKANGQFARNNITWKLANDIAYCYCNGKLLFFTDVENMRMFEDKPICKIAAGYAATKENNKTILVHRFIIGAPDWALVDHINRNKKDNRRKNLRLADKSINAFNCDRRKTNKSGVTGVRFREDTHRWCATIRKNYKNIALGCYATKEEAIKARIAGEEKYYGT